MEPIHIKEEISPKVLLITFLTISIVSVIVVILLSLILGLNILNIKSPMIVMIFLFDIFIFIFFYIRFYKIRIKEYTFGKDRFTIRGGFVLKFNKTFFWDEISDCKYIEMPPLIMAFHPSYAVYARSMFSSSVNEKVYLIKFKKGYKYIVHGELKEAVDLKSPAQVFFAGATHGRYITIPYNVIKEFENQGNRKSICHEDNRPRIRKQTNRRRF